MSKASLSYAGGWTVMFPSEGRAPQLALEALAEIQADIIPDAKARVTTETNFQMRIRLSSERVLVITRDIYDHIKQYINSNL